MLLPDLVLWALIAWFLGRYRKCGSDALEQFGCDSVIFPQLSEKRSTRFSRFHGPYLGGGGGVSLYSFVIETNTLHRYFFIADCVQPGVL